jgi:hypothetical protein
MRSLSCCLSSPLRWSLHKDDLYAVPFGANVSTDQAHAWLRLPSQPPPKDGCADTTPARKEASSAFAEEL